MVEKDDKIRLISINDPYTNLEAGDTGRVTEVKTVPASLSPRGQPEQKIWVDWDEGGKLALFRSQDSFEVVSEQADN